MTKAFGLLLPLVLLGDFPLQAQDRLSREDATALAALINLLNTPVTVASNVVSDRKKQPVSVTTISRDQIQLSGARNLMEVLNFYVPGAFHTEHQEESILAFRGFAPDNNSKVLFTLNGHVMNTEWFIGAPDGVLQSLDMDYIERIDVIRGPGSVTLGQGALLGVINVVTRGGTADATTLTGGAGKDSHSYTGVEYGSKGGDLKTYVHLARYRYAGQELRREGNATTNWLDLDPASPGYRGHIYDHERLLKSDGLTALANVSTPNFDFQFFHNDVNRDMYNFRRDRGAYQQILDSLSASYTWHLDRDQALKVHAGYDQDDYVLHSPDLGFVMGGTREYRMNGSLLYTGRFGDLTFAAGGEYKKYLMGRTNRNGANFLTQVANATMMDDPNTHSVMVYPADLDVKSLFAEAFYAINGEWDAFAAFRFDDHSYWSSATPRVGLLYGPSDQWRFRLSYQTGFRGAPGMHYTGGYEGDGLLREENFNQLATATQGHVQNLDPVQPEKMKSLEFESTYTPLQNFTFNLVLFQNRMDHLIGFNSFFAPTESWLPRMIGTDKVGDWGGSWWFQNTKGSMTSQGAELAVKYTHPIVDVNFSHATVRLSSLDQSVYSTGIQYRAQQSAGRHFGTYPEDVTRLNLVFYARQALSGSLNLLRYGTWYAPNTEGAAAKGPGQLLVNAALTSDLGRGFKATLAVNNLTNSTKLYPYDDGPKGSDPRVGAPSVEGRTYWVKVAYTF